MKKFALGVVVGIGVSALILVPLVRRERVEKFQFGRSNGLIEGRFQAADALEKEFGRYDGHAPYKVLFSVKTTDVVLTETNGVATVRVIP